MISRFGATFLVSWLWEMPTVSCWKINRFCLFIRPFPLSHPHQTAVINFHIDRCKWESLTSNDFRRGGPASYNAFPVSAYWLPAYTHTSVRQRMLGSSPHPTLSWVGLNLANGRFSRISASSLAAGTLQAQKQFDLQLLICLKWIHLSKLCGEAGRTLSSHY